MAADLEVIDAVLGGDVDRFAELVARYQRPAWQLAYSFVGNWDDAKELSQNGFLKAYRALGRFRRDAQFSTWLYRIIANECKDFFKRRDRRPRTVGLEMSGTREDEMIFEPEDPSADPGAQLANRELGKRLQAAIDALPEQQRAAFVLHHLNGLSIAEAAVVMGCQAGTVKAHLFRACEKLRGQFESVLNPETRIWRTTNS